MLPAAFRSVSIMLLLCCSYVQWLSVGFGWWRSPLSPWCVHSSTPVHVAKDAFGNRWKRLADCIKQRVIFERGSPGNSPFAGFFLPLDCWGTPRLLEIRWYFPSSRGVAGPKMWGGQTCRARTHNGVWGAIQGNRGPSSFPSRSWKPGSFLDA